MRFVRLIYGNETATAQLSEVEHQADMAAWFAYTNELQQAGKNLGGDALMPTTTAITVRGQGGQTLTADGPFAETKEQLGGYDVVEDADLDKAIAWAGRMPHLPRGGAVEIRPILEFDATWHPRRIEASARSAPAWRPSRVGATMRPRRTNDGSRGPRRAAAWRSTRGASASGSFGMTTAASSPS